MTRRELDALTFPGVHRHRMKREARKAVRPLTRRDAWRHIGACVLILVVYALFVWALTAGEPEHPRLDSVFSPPSEAR